MSQPQFPLERPSPSPFRISRLPNRDRKEAGPHPLGAHPQ